MDGDWRPVYKLWIDWFMMKEPGKANIKLIGCFQSADGKRYPLLVLCF